MEEEGKAVLHSALLEIPPDGLHTCIIVSNSYTSAAVKQYQPGIHHLLAGLRRHEVPPSSGNISDSDRYRAVEIDLI